MQHAFPGKTADGGGTRGCFNKTWVSVPPPLKPHQVSLGKQLSYHTSSRRLKNLEIYCSSRKNEEISKYNELREKLFNFDNEIHKLAEEFISNLIRFNAVQALPYINK
jgi:hypothetical protein